MEARLNGCYPNRWLQPDSIIPDPGQSITYDRYAYARNNPVRYNDPTGHDVGCGGRDGSDCISVGKLNPAVIRRNLLLKHRQLVYMVRDWQINDLEGLALFVKYAASYTPYNTSEFVQTVGSVLTGHDSGRSATNEVKIQVSNILANNGRAYNPGVSYSSEYTEIAGDAELMQSGYDKRPNLEIFILMRIQGRISASY